MYSRITYPILEIYDGETGAYIGKARFDMSGGVEHALLQLVNYGIAPSSLVLLNIDLYEPAEGYLTPIPFRKYKRMGTLTAIYTDQMSGEQVPIEISFTYDALARSMPLNNLYRSVEFSDIKITDVRRVA